MTEAVLQYAWENMRFNPVNLKTTLGKEIILLNIGRINRNDGPDFLNASVIIDGINYSGAVELHLSTPLWFKHGHQQDSNYDKVILHVVYQTDLQPVFRSDGTIIPELELSGYLEADFVNIYEQLFSNGNRLPCKGLTEKIPTEIVNDWLCLLGRERLKDKCKDYNQLLIINQNNWHETVWQAVAERFGGNINKQCFKAVAVNVPYRIISRNRTELLNIESLLFGSAGFLETDFFETYPQELKTRWLHLKQKYNLEKIEGHLFCFGGLRPVNFPTIRMAQLARLIHYSDDWLSCLDDPEAMKRILENITLTGYWENHFRPGIVSKNIKKTLGKDFILQWMINCWIPLGIMFNEHKNNIENIAKLNSFLLNLKPEQNSITDDFHFLIKKYNNALQTQGLIKLERDYCASLRCLDCVIGKNILRRSELNS